MQLELEELAGHGLESWVGGTASDELTPPLVANGEFWHDAAQNENAPEVVKEHLEAAPAQEVSDRSDEA